MNKLLVYTGVGFFILEALFLLMFAMVQVLIVNDIALSITPKFVLVVILVLLNLLIGLLLFDGVTLKK